MVRILLNCFLVTARKRSLQRLCFYTCLSVILFTGGSLPHCMLGYTPQTRGRYPPGSRHSHRPEAGNPPPSAVHAERYEQQAGGMHPTGMLSWFSLNSANKLNFVSGDQAVVSLVLAKLLCKIPKEISGSVKLHIGDSWGKPRINVHA